MRTPRRAFLTTNFPLLFFRYLGIGFAGLIGIRVFKSQGALRQAACCFGEIRRRASYQLQVMSRQIRVIRLGTRLPLRFVAKKKDNPLKLLRFAAEVHQVIEFCVVLAC